MAGYSGRLLIVDDDEVALRFWQLALGEHGFRIEVAYSLSAMREIVGRYSFDAVLLDLHLADEDGLAAIPFLLGESPFTRIFILTSHGSIDSAVDAMQKGASGYITKDKDPHTIAHEIKSHLTASAIDASKPMQELFYELGFIGEGPAFQNLCATLECLKAVDSTVLICGESGTGKEVIARTLHALSPRAQKRFEAINCAAIPPGLLESELFGHTRGSFTDAKVSRKGIFELCSQGTLLLDEIGDMPLALQTKILRVLQEQTITPLGSSHAVKIDTRIIAATHRDLVEEVQRGRFREDLYYRLTVVPVRVPPLRQRKEDVPLLVDHFIKQFSNKFAKDIKPPAPALMRRLLSYDWPGNVRELRNTIERGIVLSKDGQLTVEGMFHHLHWQRNPHSNPHSNPQSLNLSQRNGADPAKAMDDLFKLSLNEAKQVFEKIYMEQLLSETHGNITKAAKRAGRYRSDIYRLIDKYGLSREH